MPYQLVWEARGVYRRYHGDLSAAERHASLEAICNDRRFDDLRYTITDYRDVGHYEQSEDDTALIAAKHIGPSMSNPRILIAAIALRADIVKAIEHFIALGMTQLPYRIFSNVDDARLWIEAHHVHMNHVRQR
jgi:hypothetical protein